MSTQKGERGKFTILQVFSVFYFVAGVLLLAAMTQTKNMPFYIGFIGALNVAVSYSLTKMRKWSLYLTVFVSILSLIFGCVAMMAGCILFSSSIIEMLILAGITLYSVLSFSLLVYVILKKDRFS